MSVTPSGHIGELPGGSFRVAVYLGAAQITRKRMYFRETVKGTTEAQITLGRLPAKAQAGKEPEAGPTVSQLPDLYLPLAEWDVSTRELVEGYVRRTIRPAWGTSKACPARSSRGPVRPMPCYPLPVRVARRGRLFRGRHRVSRQRRYRCPYGDGRSRCL